jgi:hypothetical protein
MTTLERIAKALDAIVTGGDRNSWTRHLVVALFPRLMLATAAARFERQTRRSETCMLCLIEVR